MRVAALSLAAVLSFSACEVTKNDSRPGEPEDQDVSLVLQFEGTRGSRGDIRVVVDGETYFVRPGKKPGWKETIEVPAATDGSMQIMLTRKSNEKCACIVACRVSRKDGRQVPVYDQQILTPAQSSGAAVCVWDENFTRG
jgi:hypothetical protein